MAATTAAVVGAVAAVGGTISQNNNSKKAIKKQEEQNAANTALIQRQASKAEKKAVPLFEEAQVAREQGVQRALDVFGQTIPEQARMFQQGNVAAQQNLLSGLPLFQSAILGLPVDNRALGIQSLDPNLDFAQQQVSPLFAPEEPVVEEPMTMEQLQDTRDRLVASGTVLPFASSSGEGSVSRAVAQTAREQGLASLNSQIQAMQNQPLTTNVPNINVLGGIETTVGPQGQQIPTSSLPSSLVQGVTLHPARPTGGLQGSGRNSFNTFG
jgi:hypothetical protein